MSDQRRFPIMGVWIGRTHLLGGSIPWGMIAPHAVQAHRNHSATLEVLAERGGLSWSEALAVLLDRPWRRMDERKAQERVTDLTLAYCTRAKP